MHKKIYSLLIVASVATTATASENTSQYWQNYLASRNANSDLIDVNKYELDGLIPPNFSYAGYQTGATPLPQNIDPSYKVFNILDFGAIANDNVSDKPAFQRMAKAVSEYVKNGTNGAVFYVPKGRYIINSDSDNQLIDKKDKQQITHHQTIRIIGSNIVIKGDGADKTILVMKDHLFPESESKMWSTPYLVQVGGDKSKFKTATTTKVVKDAIRGSSFDVYVADASTFNVGDYVELEGNISNQERIKEAIDPYKFERNKQGKPLWAALAANLRKLEKHRIIAINGNRMTFDVPIAHNIIAQDTWTVSKINPAANIGIQDLSFEGAWNGDFIHHKNAIHDSGYSFLRLSLAVDSWIKNVKITNFSQGIQVANSFNTTVQDITLTGNPGHLALSILYGNHNLIKDVNDSAHTWHAPGLSKFSTHNVILRSRYSPKMGLDLHGAQSMDNLFDNVRGGFVKGHWGAAVQNQPNHLKGLYLWNAENLGESNKDLYFMSSDGKYGKLIMPHLIGLHGNPLQVQSQREYMQAATQKQWAEYKHLPAPNVAQAYIESNGKRVFPESLYEAQLDHRLSLKEK